MSGFRLLVGLSTVALFALTAVQADAKKAAAKKPPAEKCMPYGDDSAGTQMCGTMRK